MLILLYFASFFSPKYVCLLFLILEGYFPPLSFFHCLLNSQHLQIIIIIIIINIIIIIIIIIRVSIHFYLLVFY